MKNLIVGLIILIVFLFAVAAWAMIAYAKPIQFGDLKMTVIPEVGKVFVKSGSGEFLEITNETEIQVGDVIKTDETGRARLVLFDANEVTIDKDSEIFVEESFIDKETPFLTKVKIKLEKGQIWNRLLEFLHPDSYFEVEAGGVVATVRGTVFNFLYQDGKADISVLEDQVSILEKETGKTAVLNVDESFSLEKGAKQAKIEKIKDELKQEDWFKNNFKRDENFRTEVKEKRDKILEQVGPLPGSPVYPVKVFGEKMSLVFTFDNFERQNKINNFEARKILEARLLWAQGEKTQALNNLKTISKTSEAWRLVKQFDYYDRESLKVLKGVLAQESFAKEYLGSVLSPDEVEFIKGVIKVEPVLPLLEKTEEVSEGVIGIEPSEVPSELVGCVAGAYMDTPEGRAKIIGMERHEIQGETRLLCCTEIATTVDDEVMRMKVCCGSTTDVKLSVSFIYDEEKGGYVRVSETYPKGEKSCVRMFDPETGSLLSEVCL